MRRLGNDRREIAAAQRGQVIQRILVDGWTPAQAAAALGIEERRVARWVAAYRRHGMASLQNDLAGERLPRRWIGWLKLHLARLFAAARGETRRVQPAPCVVLRRTGDRRHLR